MTKKSASPRSRRVAAASRFEPIAARLDVAVDYPAEGERVRPGHYAVRVAACGASEACVRVDDGPWQKCRAAVGYFWYDWSPGASRALLQARARRGKGRWAASPARSCVID